MKNANTDIYKKYGILGRRIRLFRWLCKMRSDWLPIVLKEDFGFVDNIEFDNIEKEENNKIDAK